MADTQNGGHRLSKRIRITSALAFVASLACGGGYDSTAAHSSTYVATLTGAKERPAPTSSTAAGTATFTLIGRRLAYLVTSTPFATALTLGHVHIGSSGVAGPVIVPFTIATQSGTVASGTIDLSQPLTSNTITISGDSLLALFDRGNAYVNLHTAAFPGGEIRGQIVRQ